MLVLPTPFGMMCMVAMWLLLSRGFLLYVFVCASFQYVLSARPRACEFPGIVARPTGPFSDYAECPRPPLLALRVAAAGAGGAERWRGRSARAWVSIPSASEGGSGRQVFGELRGAHDRARHCHAGAHACDELAAEFANSVRVASSAASCCDSETVAQHVSIVLRQGSSVIGGCQQLGIWTLGVSSAGAPEAMLSKSLFPAIVLWAFGRSAMCRALFCSHLRVASVELVVAACLVD